MDDVDVFVGKVISNDGLRRLFKDIMLAYNIRLVISDYINSVNSDNYNMFNWITGGFYRVEKIVDSCIQEYSVDIIDIARMRMDYEDVLGGFFGRYTESGENNVGNSEVKNRVIRSDGVCCPFYVVFNGENISDVKFFDVECLTACEYRYFTENIELVYDALLFKAHRSSRYIATRRKSVVVLFSSICTIYRNSFSDTNGTAYVQFDRDAVPTSEGLKASIIGVYGLGYTIENSSDSKKYTLYRDLKNVLPECRKPDSEVKLYWERELNGICDLLIEKYDNNEKYIENAWLKFLKSRQIENIYVKYNRFRTNRLGLNSVDIGYLSPSINVCNLGIPSGMP